MSSDRAERTRTALPIFALRLGIAFVYFIYLFIYLFIFICHTIIEITNNMGKVVKRSGEQTQQKLWELMRG